MNGNNGNEGALWKYFKASISIVISHDHNEEMKVRTTALGTSFHAKKFSYGQFHSVIVFFSKICFVLI